MSEDKKDILKVFLVIGLLLLTVFGVIFFRSNIRMILVVAVMTMTVIVGLLAWANYRRNRSEELEKTDTDETVTKKVVKTEVKTIKQPFLRRLQIFWGGLVNLLLIIAAIAGVIWGIAWVMARSDNKKAAKQQKIEWYKRLEVMPSDREGRKLRDSTSQVCHITEDTSGFVMTCRNKYGTDQFTLPYGSEVGNYQRLNQRRGEDKVYGTFTIQKAKPWMYLGRETTGTGKESSFVIIRSDHCKTCG